MMSEKRFYRASVCGDEGLYDKEDGCIIVNVRSNIDLDDNWDTVVEKLNEQQDLIEELYDFRLTYNALLFNEWAENRKYEVYKSRKHNDGELCFNGEYFIVVAQLPTGQVTNHYHIRHWDMFKIEEYEKVKVEFDGHTPSDVIGRLQQVIDL